MRSIKANVKRSSLGTKRSNAVARRQAVGAAVARPVEMLEVRRLLAAIEFEPGQVVGSMPIAASAVVAVDMTSDSLPDLAAANAKTRRAWWLNPDTGDADYVQDSFIDLSFSKNNGDGTFTRTWETSISVALIDPGGGFGGDTTDYYSARLTYGDLNGDGKPDLVASASSDSRFFTMLGNGDGTFQSPTPFTITATPQFTAAGVGIGDFNRDGKQDFAVADGNANRLAFAYGNGAGGVAAVALFTTVEAANHVAVADLDGDRFDDLVIQGGTSLLSVVNTNQPQPTTYTLSNRPRYARDLAVGNLLGSSQPASFAEVRFDASPSFLTVVPRTPGAATTYTLTGPTLSSLAIADIDQDGKGDVVFGNRAARQLGVFRGLGNGSLESNAAATFNMPTSGNYILGWDHAVADFNDDGLPDIVATTENTDRVIVFLQKSPLMVTTTVDENNGNADPNNGTGTSLREAVAYAANLGGRRAITFASSLANANAVVNLRNGPIVLPSGVNLRISNWGGQITIDGNNTGSPFVVPGNAELSLRNLTVRNLRGAASYGNNGGAVWIGGGGRLNVDLVTFSSISASGLGGVIYNDGGTVNVTRSRFLNNSGGEGGAIQSAGTLNIADSAFAANASGFNGGALRLFGNATISRSTFNANTAVNEGSALISFGNLTVMNATFADNGGRDAITLTSGNADLRHVTVANNRVRGLAIGGANVTLRNSIVAGNVGGDLFGSTNALSSNNLVNVSTSAVRLGALSDNGGVTQTMALLPGSPAINAGMAIDGVTTDQRGVVRPQHGTPDVGAYEFNGSISASLVVTTATDESNFTSDPAFGTGTSLREAIAFAEANPGPDVITFAEALVGQAITLNAGWNGPSDDTSLRVLSELTIDGGNRVTISPALGSRRRVFLSGGSTFTLKNLAVTGGDLRSVNDGGAIWSSGPVVIDNVRFSNNRANFGGAILSSGGALTIANSTFDGNNANNAGGAIWSNGTVTIADSTFSSNAAAGDGGALKLDNNSTIRRSTFNGNSSTSGGGGAIHAVLGSAKLDIENSTFTANSAGAWASAIWTGSQSNVWSHLTVVNNTAPAGRGAVLIQQVPVTLRNSIVAGNTNDGAVTFFGTGTGTFTPQSTNNLVGNGGWTGLNAATNQLDVSMSLLRLGSLASNGGPTQTMMPLPGSAAINAGTAIVGVAADQRGTARPQGAVVDIGAVERAATSAAAQSATFEVATRQALTFTFNGDASVTFSRSDVALTNLTTNQSVPAIVGSLQWNEAGTHATLVLTNQLADGNYRADIGSTQVDFFVLGGDFNRDRAADFDDLLVLAANYNQSGRDNTQGDANYDGVVSFDDLLILAANYNRAITGAPSNSPLVAPPPPGGTSHPGGDDDDDEGDNHALSA